MARFDPRARMRDRITFTRASHIARGCLGEFGTDSLYLQRENFDSTAENAFTEEEIDKMEKDFGLVVPTEDERGRIFDVKITRSTSHYLLSTVDNSGRGWRRLCFMNDFKATSIMSLWIYREALQLGPIMKLPHLLVLTEDDPYCARCQRMSLFGY
ncbi:hypothetical protein BUALT_Bualt14G0022200 [Buddleja alternifolia]|uniref:Uncharacterized protein n=1 Tax=Buddleja alternifolia TaxID=168488 RepID=A0AAV6WE67_9LAMI|nr:hypothetical protein BUALT_Bualt14G0022200 [Buddleja alternifolia]